MRAAAFTGFDGPESVQLEDVPDPEPAAGEAVLSVDACSINRHDLWIVEGDSAMVAGEELPFVSGLDVAGTVEDIGADVEDVVPGDRVLLCPNRTCRTCVYCREGPENRCVNYSLYHGGLAEQACCRADRLIALPDSVSMTDAAALPTAYMTAYHMLQRTETAAGDLVFVPGATGGVGVAAVQLADALGARSIGTTTSAEKATRLRELADHVIQSADTETLATEIEAIGAPDVVCNHLGGEFTQLGLDVMKRGGRMAICGRTAGGTSEIDVPDLFLSHQQVLGSTMGTQGDLERIVRLLEDGAFEPPIGETYALANADQAFADMQTREAFGKLLVRP